jgi:4'-phosphopantetheinyl transferase EntD
MTAQIVERTLPHGHAVAVTLAADDVEAAARQLHATEEARARDWAPARRATWVAGRCALRAALAGAGLGATGPLLTTPRGAPMVPPEVTASVAHKAVGSLVTAVALAAPASRGPVGIDLEALEPERLGLEAGILSAAELAALAPIHGRERWQAVLTRFCLKEATFKALDPIAPCDLDLREVAAWPLPTGAATLEWTALHAVPPDRVSARWEIMSPWVLATARVDLANAGAATHP